MARISKPSRTLRSELKRLDQQQRRDTSSSAFASSGMTIIEVDQVLQPGSNTIPDNGLFLVDGGDVVMLDEAPSATELFRLGQQENGDRGITIRRSDGTIAIEIRKAFGPGDASQVVFIRDRIGRVIAGDSVLSFTGFDAPHIPLPFIPVDYTSGAPAQTTSSTLFVPLHQCRTLHQNPAMLPVLAVKCSDATTSAEVQFFDVLNGAYLGGYLGTPATHTIAVPIGTTGWTDFSTSSAIQLPGNMSDPMHLQIHVRRTAGAGSVSVAPVRTIGTGF